MTMIRRYIAREIVGAVLFVLAGFLGLFAFFDFINEIDDVGQAGYRLQHALAHVLLGLPSRVYELMPIAALIGSIYALAQFASHSEFTAMRAAGLSRRGALAIVAGVGAWFAVATALTGELLAHDGQRAAQRVGVGQRVRALDFGRHSSASPRTHSCTAPPTQTAPPARSMNTRPSRCSAAPWVAT